MTRHKRYRSPITPPQMANHGNFIISLGQLVPILGQEAEKLGVDVFPGFAAPRRLFDAAGAVKGVRIGDMGIEKNGEPGPNFALGPEIHAKITLFCEGCRGSISKQLIKRFKLDAGKSPQTYGLGFKELWQLPPGRVQPGLIQHTAGLAARQQHLRRQLSVSPRTTIGCMSASWSAWIMRTRASSPSRHSSNRRIIPTSSACCKGGEIIAGGARTVIEGGYQSMPTLEMPGAMLVGDAGGTLNMPKIKGIHQAIRSGMTAAAHYRRDAARAPDSISAGANRRAAANCTRCAISGPGSGAACGSGSPTLRLETVTFGKLPWTLANHADDTALKRLDEYAIPGPGLGRSRTAAARPAGVRILRRNHP